MDFHFKFFPVIYTFFVLFPNSFSTNADPCSVISRWGTYRGSLKTPVLNSHFRYCCYRDIRYGEAMLGDRRFGRPTLAEPQRSRVFDATQDRVVCAQPGAEASSEDCLFLNVYTPQVDKKRKQSSWPVMVYIHGGAYTNGSKTTKEFGPDYFLPHDVVLVTINYRLNAFGFLNLGIPECSGNMGLRDQIVALEWVQKNIRAFGGDPKRVTLMGQSAGAISVYLLKLSPLARGLFDKVIIESAITTDVFAKTPDLIVRRSIEFAQFLGYKGDSKDRHSILRFLRHLGAADIANGYSRFMDKLAKTDDRFFYVGSPLWPCYDRQVRNGVLPSTSLEQLGKVDSDVSCIIGCNNADADAYSFPYDPYIIVDYVSKHLDLYIGGLDPAFRKNRRTLDAVIANVTKYYYRVGNGRTKLDDTIRMLNYITFDDLYEQMAVHHSAYTRNRMWLYEFRYTGGTQNYKKVILMSRAHEVKGASHSAELEYLFHASQFYPNGFNATKKELEVIHIMSTLWTNFAKFGNPNSRGDDIRLKWKPTSPEQSNYLQIDETIKFISNEKVFQNERNFFNELREWARNN